MALRFSPTRGAASFVLSSYMRGPTGAAATVAVGSVTTLVPGSTPTIVNIGSTAAAVLNFGIPTSKTVSVGTTTTGQEGTSASVADSGDASSSVFNFTIPRGASPAIGYLFSTTTTDSDPGNGNVRFNSATPASITTIYFDNLDADGNTVTSWLDTMDDSTTSGNKGSLIFTDVSSPSTKMVFDVTGASVVDGTGYRKVTVAHNSGATLFTNLRRLSVSFSRTGNKGADGAGDLTAANNLSDVASAATAFANIKQAATDSATGVVELATAAETTTGTDATRAVTPDGLAGSDFGKRIVSIFVFDDSQNCTTGDGAGDVFWRVPAVLNGYNLVAVAAQVQTAGTTGTMDVQIARIRSGTPADMLSTKITIDSTEIDSSTAATPAVINGSNDDVATADQIRIDVDAVQTTPAKGLMVELTFQLP